MRLFMLMTPLHILSLVFTVAAVDTTTAIAMAIAIVDVAAAAIAVYVQ